MLTEQEIAALTDCMGGYPSQESFQIVGGMVVAAMSGNPVQFERSDVGPGESVVWLTPTDDTDLPWTILVDRTHGRPAILVFNDGSEAQEEFERIWEFAVEMAPSGRLPPDVRESVMEWIKNSGSSAA